MTEEHVTEQTQEPQEQMSLMDQIDDMLKDVPETPDTPDAPAEETVTPEPEATPAAEGESLAPSAADLREVMGDAGKDLSDEELVAAYEKLPPEPEEKPASAEAPAPWSRPYKLYMADGTQVESLQGLTPEQVLDAEIGYTQDGQEVRRTIEGLARTAARVPLQDRRIASVVEQRNAEGAKAKELEAELEQRRIDAQWFANILSDRTGERYQAAQEEYERVMLQGGSLSDMTRAAPAAAPAPSQATTDAQGELYYQQQIVPVLQQIAEKLSADGSPPAPEEQQAILQNLNTTARTLIQQEGTHLTMPRLQEIVYQELPARALDSGLKQVVTKAEAPASDTALMAELANARLALKKARLAQAPPSSGRKGSASAKAVAGSIEALEQATSASDVEDWLDDPTSGL
jgi:hypothetical protein